MHLYAVVYSAYTLSNQFKLVIKNTNTYFVEQYTKYQEEREREKRHEAIEIAYIYYQ